MTVQELIDILKTQDPTEIVMIEGMRGGTIIDDDWSRCLFEHEGENLHCFCLHAYGDWRGPSLEENADAAL